MKGILYGIGVGPGDPELMTFKAYRCILDCDVMILPSEPKEDCYAYRIARAACPKVEEKELICLPFPMIRDTMLLEQAHEEIYRKVAGYLEQGKNTGFLTIGDPSVYSTYSYVQKKAVKEGRPTVVVSGVPSFCAAAASMGISLGDNREEIHIIPGSYDVEQTMDLEGTRVYMKSGKKLEEFKNAILRSKRANQLQIHTISNCGMAGEQIWHGISGLEKAQGYLTIVIVKE